MTHHHIYPVDRLLALRHYHSTTLSIQPDQRFYPIRSAKVVSCHLAALQPEPQAAESNSWALLLEMCNTRMVFIELKEADPQGKTIVVCSERPFTFRNGALQGCFKSWPIMVKQDVSVGTWLDLLVVSGTTRYLLTKSSAGLRSGATWWMHCTLDVLDRFFTDRLNLQDLKIWLRLGWAQDGKPLHDGEMQMLQRGTWLEGSS